MKLLQLLFIGILALPINANAQKRKKTSSEPNIALTDSLFHDLKWRNIGPFRGGRSVTSTGVIGKPHTYYMGSTGGGVYKTTDDGITWNNISDKFFKTSQLNTTTSQRKIV